MQYNAKDGKPTVLPLYVRALCVITLLLLALSALFELWMMISPWFQGVAFRSIVAGYQEAMPCLREYVIPLTPLVYIGTLILDFLSFIPYYAALFSAAFLFYSFFCGFVWTKKNINLLKAISALIIFDAIFPVIKDFLQVLLFTLDGEHIFQISLGFSAGPIRSVIVGFSVYVFGVVIDKAKKIDDEIQLIV
ncbi:hypothetical protein ACFL9S_13250 [Erwinia sp. AnSW2-5]|uniref:hypothetical protein n=1 Tax=Erwinia sp. AnSW2-5 TaxID=3367692 RepID=UPI00385E342F